MSIPFCSNILQLMNAFNYPEGTITESNYKDVLDSLNHTSPGIIQGLAIENCNMHDFLSQVCVLQYRHGALLLIPQTMIYLSSFSLTDHLSDLQRKRLKI